MKQQATIAKQQVTQKLYDQKTHCIRKRTQPRLAGFLVCFFLFGWVGCCVCVCVCVHVSVCCVCVFLRDNPSKTYGACAPPVGQGRRRGGGAKKGGQCFIMPQQSSRHTYHLPHIPRRARHTVTRPLRWCRFHGLPDVNKAPTREHDAIPLAGQSVGNR